MEQSEGTSEKSVKIVRGRVDSLSLYEITDHELGVLEKGSPSSLYLNFSVFFLSVATSLLIALLTAPFHPGKLFTVFVVVTVVGFAIGLFLLVLWHRTRQQVGQVVSKIKKRIPSETGEQSEAS